MRTLRLGVMAAITAGVLLVIAVALSGVGWRTGSLPDGRWERAPQHASRVGAAPYVDAAADGQQSFFGDLEVESGQTLDGDVIVYSGNVTIKEAGRISGDLVVYSGDVDIREGARASGNVTAFSGNVTVAGEVGGNLAAASGDVTLRETARVNGNVSVLSGDLHRSEGAFVGGDTVTGPDIPLPNLPSIPLPFLGAPDAAQGAFAEPARSVLGSLGRFVARSVGVGLAAVLVGLLIAVAAVVRPDYIERTRRTVQEEPAMSFVVGILANVVALVVAGILAITICLSPLSAVMLAAVGAVNFVGWAAISAALAQRAALAERLAIRYEHALGLTAMMIAAGLGMFWAAGGCFRFLGMAASLVISSVGAGAVLLPLLRRHVTGPARPIVPGGPEPGS